MSLALPRGDHTILVQDDRTRSADEFRSNVLRISAYIENNLSEHSMIAVQGDNRIESLEIIVGVLLSGRDAIGIPNFLVGALSEKFMRASGASARIGLGTGVLDPEFGYELPADGFEAQSVGRLAVASSGSTGMPKISSLRLDILDSSDVGNVSELMFEKMDLGPGARVFYPAPLLTVTVVFLVGIIQQFVMVTTNKAMTTEIIELAMQSNGCQLLYARPSLIARLEADGFVPNPELRVIASAGSSLGRQNIRYVIDSLHLGLCDIYSTSETGIIGIRMVPDSDFTLFDHISMYEESGSVVCESELSAGIWRNGAIIENYGVTVMDDILEVGSGTARLIERASGKIKVHGFTVISSVVSEQIMSLPGVEDCVVLGRDGELVAYMSGRCYNSDEIRELLSDKLPSYSIPSKVISVERISSTIKEGVRGREQYALPTTDRG